MNKKKLSKQHIESLRRAWVNRKAKGLGVPWNKNKEWSKEHREGLRKAWIKRKEKGLGVAWNKGKKLSKKHAEKCKIARLGKKHTEETKKKMSRSACKRDKNNQWKGDDVGYRGLHTWVERVLGKPKRCEYCGKDGLTGRKIHWANKSGKYLRDKSDWIRLCVCCHREYDRK